MVTTIQLKASEHPIKSVTIFKSSKAEIVRTFSLSLTAGQNHVEVTGLPSSIDTESARVSGLGDAKLFDVVCSINQPSSLIILGESEHEAVRILETQKVELEHEKAIVEEQASVISEYAKSLKAEHVSTQDMASFMQSFLTQKKEALKEFSELKEKILELQRQIAKERERLAAKKGQATAKVSAVIVAQTDGPAKIVLTYIVSNAQWEPTYDLHAMTDQGKTSRSVSLHYRAKIMQTTGEDWKDTALILSTTSTETMMGGIPPLQACNLSVNNFRSRNFGPSVNNNLFGPSVNNNPFGQNQQQNMLEQQFQTQQQQQQQRSAFGSSVGLFGAVAPPPPGPASAFGQPLAAPQPTGFSGTSAFGAMPAPQTASAGGLFGAHYVGQQAATSGSPPPPPNDLDGDDDWVAEDEELSMQPVTEGLAVINKSPLSISYAVEGLSSIPTDGELHKVSVAVLPFEADVTFVTMPRQNAVAYMQSAVKNTSDFRLLPGPVAVFLDNSYVSKTSISDINTGDTFHCTFGVDTSTRISYTRTSKFRRDPASAFSEQFKTITFTSTTKILNQHSFPIAIVSKDTVPLCADKRVKVILRKPEGLVDAKEESVNLSGEDGIKVRWCKVIGDKGGEKEGKFEWVGSVKAGKEISLVTEWEVKCPVDVFWQEDGLAKNQVRGGWGGK